MKRPSATCPFCGERDLAVVAVPRGLQVRRVAGALAIGASLAACASTPPDDGCVRDHGGVVAEYGAPPRCEDAGFDAGDADAGDGRADGASDGADAADADSADG